MAIRKSEAFDRIAPLLGIKPSETRLWARHLREGGHISDSLPGHGISEVTENELINFVIGFCCCRHAKHSPKYLDLVKSMTRESKFEAVDPERRLLPAFLGQRNAIDAIRQAVWDVYNGNFSEWGRGDVPKGQLPSSGSLVIEFGLDGAYVEFSGSRFDHDDKLGSKRVAHFSAFYSNHWEPGMPLRMMRKDDDDLLPGADLQQVKRIGLRTLHTIGEILIEN